MIQEHKNPYPLYHRGCLGVEATSRESGCPSAEDIAGSFLLSYHSLHIPAPLRVNGAGSFPCPNDQVGTLDKKSRHDIDF